VAALVRLREPGLRLRRVVAPDAPA
jgi:hypothetical protein